MARKSWFKYRGIRGCICNLANEKNYLLAVFDVFASDGDWAGVDLNKVAVLFAIFFSTENVKNISSSFLSSESVTPNARPVEKRMLSAIFGAPGDTGAKLIDLSDEYSNIGAQVVKESLSPQDDLSLIHRYELRGMAGDPEKIIARIKN